jgi:hypothetical protein
MKVDGEPLPMGRKKIVRLVVRPKAQRESGYEKIAFLHTKVPPEFR